ncbi:MAG: ABC transporter permease [Actinomycetales bacterium]|nr:MAG: ABC transporter permease [Actinomycetales bacterium]
MNLHRLLANSRRVLQQLRHDPRSMALMVFAPVLLLTILKYVYYRQPEVFQNVAVSMLGVFPMLVMFLITSVSTLRERTSGTLERLMVSPISKVEFIGGYAIAFGFASFIQAILVSSFAIGPLGLRIQGSQLALIWVAILDALLGLAIGLFVSSFAKTEFQAIQFLPVVLLPQLLLSGLLVPRSQMPRTLSDLSNALPLSYAIDATRKVAMGSESIVHDSLVIVAFLFGLLLVGSLTLHRRTR